MNSKSSSSSALSEGLLAAKAKMSRRCHFLVNEKMNGMEGLLLHG